MFDILHRSIKTTLAVKTEAGRSGRNPCEYSTQEVTDSLDAIIMATLLMTIIQFQNEIFARILELHMYFFFSTKNNFSEASRFRQTLVFSAFLSHHFAISSPC